MELAGRKIVDDGRIMGLWERWDMKLECAMMIGTADHDRVN